MKTEKTNLSYNEMYNLVENFIVHNIKDETFTKINYKLTSHSWAKIIGNWAGVEISPLVVNDVCKEYNIESREMAKDIFVFAMEIEKVLK